MPYKWNQKYEPHLCLAVIVHKVLNSSEKSSKLKLASNCWRVFGVHIRMLLTERSSVQQLHGSASVRGATSRYWTIDRQWYTCSRQLSLDQPDRLQMGAQPKHQGSRWLVGEALLQLPSVPCRYHYSKVFIFCSMFSDVALESWLSLGWRLREAQCSKASARLGSRHKSFDYITGHRGGQWP